MNDIRVLNLMQFRLLVRVLYKKNLRVWNVHTHYHDRLSLHPVAHPLPSVPAKARIYMKVNHLTGFVRDRPSASSVPRCVFSSLEILRSLPMRGMYGALDGILERLLAR